MKQKANLDNAITERLQRVREDIADYCVQYHDNATTHIYFQFDNFRQIILTPTQPALLVSDDLWS